MSGVYVTCDGLLARLDAACTDLFIVIFLFFFLFVSPDAGLTKLVIQGQTLEMKCLTVDVNVEDGTNIGWVPSGCSEGRLAGLVWGFLTLTPVLELLVREENYLPQRLRTLGICNHKLKK